MSHSHQTKCFFSLVKEAVALKKLFRLYVREKEYGKSESNNANAKKCLCSKILEPTNSSDFKKHSSRARKNGYFESFLVEDSIQNFMLKSLLGFLGGILLTYICFMFLVFSLNFTLNRATYICMVLGVILSLGLAFSVKIRQIFPIFDWQLFSKRGRQALLAYAFILALSGPAKNTLHNVEVMSESLACGQEQIKQAENELLKCVHRPNAAAKKSVEKLLIKLNNAVKYFKNFVLQFYRTCFDVLETLFHAQKWLHSISLLCNNKMGDPVERCQNLLIDSSETCQAATDLLYWRRLCQFNPFAVQLICTTYGDRFCDLRDVHQCPPIEALQQQLDTFKRRALNILYVRVDVHQTFTQSNRSNTFHEEYQGMATEIRQKTDQFLQYFDFMSVIFGIFILVLFVKVIIYRHKFLTEDHYDNRFITPDFEDIDNTRAEFKMETILPLKPREKTKYIKVTSIRLVPCEKIRLLSSFVFLIFATFKIIIHMLTDSSLYWILSSVRRDERLLYMSTLKEEEPGIVMRIQGSGMAAALFRNVSDTVERQYFTPKLDPTPCLPDPVSPDWNRYYQILALVMICWLLALFEPYGLRLRHTVMVTYHPDRARERAIWLYNRIISHRNSYVKIARREIRRKYKNAPKEPVFIFLGGKKSMKCLLCKIKVVKGDNHIKCKTMHCVGLFCYDCYCSLKYCSICTDPSQYGDLSDVSEEKDSSEEEAECAKHGVKDIDANAKIRNNIMGVMNIKKPQFKKSLEEPLSNPRKLLRPGILQQAFKYCGKSVVKRDKTHHLSGLSEGVSDDEFADGNRGSESKPIKKPKKLDKNQTPDLNEINSSNQGSKKLSTEQLRTPSSLTEPKRSLSYGLKKWNDSEAIMPVKRPQPDFWFRNIKPALKEKSQPKPGFLMVKDSTEILINCKKRAKTDEERRPCTSTNSSSCSTSHMETEVESECRVNVERVRLIIKKNSEKFDRSLKSKDFGVVMTQTKKENENTEKIRIDSALVREKDHTTGRHVLSNSTKRLRQCKARVCTRLGSSSDSPTDSYRLCSNRRKQSSNENHKSSSNSKECNFLRRTSGAVNFTDKNSAHKNSVEEKHSPEKPSQRVRSCIRNFDATTGSSNKTSSTDEESERSQRQTRVKKKSSQLSWAPDLLSDLPLSKKGGSGTSTDKD